MKKPEPKLEIKNFQHALELAYEHDLNGHNAFNSKYGSENSFLSLRSFFKEYFGGEMGAKFARGFAGLRFDMSFFRGLDEVGKLPAKWKKYLEIRARKNESAKVFILLRSLSDTVGEDVLPRTVLPSDTHQRPLSEQVEIVKRVNDYILTKLPLKFLEAGIEARKNGIKRYEIGDAPHFESGIERWKNEIVLLQDLIAKRKSFMSRQRLRQRQLRVKKVKGSLKPKMSLRR